MPKKKRGPKEDRLIIQGDWKDAVKRAVKKPRPRSGWPEPEKTPKPKVAEKPRP